MKPRLRIDAASGSLSLFLALSYLLRDFVQSLFLELYYKPPAIATGVEAPKNGASGDLLVRAVFAGASGCCSIALSSLPCWLIESLRDVNTLLEARYEATQDDWVPSRAVRAARSLRSPGL